MAVITLRDQYQEMSTARTNMPARRLPEMQTLLDAQFIAGAVAAMTALDYGTSPRTAVAVEDLRVQIIALAIELGIQL
jgi:uncharacterized protein YjiK